MREGTGVCSLVPCQCDDVTDRSPQLFFQSTDKLPEVIALAVFPYPLSVMNMNHGRQANSHGSNVSRFSGRLLAGHKSCSRHRSCYISIIWGPIHVKYAVINSWRWRGRRRLNLSVFVRWCVKTLLLIHMVVI